MLVTSELWLPSRTNVYIYYFSFSIYGQNYHVSLVNVFWRVRHGNWSMKDISHSLVRILLLFIVCIRSADFAMIRGVSFSFSSYCFLTFFFNLRKQEELLRDPVFRRHNYTSNGRLQMGELVQAVCVSVCPTDRPSDCPSVWLYVCFECLSVCTSVHPSVCSIWGHYTRTPCIHVQECAVERKTNKQARNLCKCSFCRRVLCTETFFLYWPVFEIMWSCVSVSSENTKCYVNTDIYIKRNVLNWYNIYIVI